MAEFYKVSFEQFRDACKKEGVPFFSRSDDTIRTVYDLIKLPQRATGGSAGYDFFLPICADFDSESEVLIPTGIGIKLDPGTFLMCVPRSGLGFKYGMRLLNTAGVIDEDYSCADNEGHIMTRIKSERPFSLFAGDRFIQGIIMNYRTVEHDKPIQDERSGGFGSTGGV